MFIYIAAFMREDFTEREVQRHDFLVVFEIEVRSWYVFVKPDGLECQDEYLKHPHTLGQALCFHSARVESMDQGRHPPAGKAYLQFA